MCCERKNTQAAVCGRGCAVLVHPALEAASQLGDDLLSVQSLWGVRATSFHGTVHPDRPHLPVTRRSPASCSHAPFPPMSQTCRCCVPLTGTTQRVHLLCPRGPEAHRACSSYSMPARCALHLRLHSSHRGSYLISRPVVSPQNSPRAPRRLYAHAAAARRPRLFHFSPHLERADPSYLRDLGRNRSSRRDCSGQTHMPAGCGKGRN